MHEFLKFIFWNKILHVSCSLSVHHQEFFTVHSDGVCHTEISQMGKIASEIRLHFS